MVNQRLFIMFFEFRENGLLHHLTLYKSLKIVMILCLQLFSYTAYAAGTCLSDKSDINEDTKKISEKLKIRYEVSPIESSEKVKANQSAHEAYVNLKNNTDKSFEFYRTFTDKYNANFDQIFNNAQELLIDRSQPFLNQVNAVGIIADAPLGINSGYATAILISPCHILTNAHAVNHKEARKGILPVFVSLGQNSCDSKNEFLHHDMQGKVIAFSDYKNNKDLLTIDDAEDFADYAIVKIKDISNIKPVIVATEYISVFETLMMIGFAHRFTYTQKTGLRYPTANFMRMKSIGLDGTFKATNSQSRAGGSGSGLFALGEDDLNNAKVYLVGIHQSEGGRGIQTAKIVERLKKNHPKVLDEVTKAIENNTCN